MSYRWSWSPAAHSAEGRVCLTGTMQKAAALIFITICALSAPSWVEGIRRSKPSASVGPAQQFGSTSTTASPNTTTPTPKPTTTPTPKPNTTTTTPKPTTTTLKPNTTTPKPTTTPTPKPNTTTTTPKPTTTTLKPNTTTPKPTTTPTPKPNTTTTTPKPTTTTLKPNTTTPKPTTTPTPKPTTTTLKPNTTTPKPTTTTTPKPTTTTPPSTTPSTNLTVGNYNLTLKGQICLMALMTLQIRLTTEQANGTFIVQPSKTKATGECAETSAKLTLTFQEGYIYFHFNKSEDMVYADTLSFSLNYPFEKGAKLPYTASNQSLHLFSARTGHSYSCKSQSVDMGKGLYLDVTQTRLQAIGLQNANFGKPDACPADQPDYRVAIAVGVTLLILIVVVIIVYFLGRRRRTEGYQSL
uniref:Si:ch211-212k18.7 n=1 Tax=Oryzias latipes TaxID=8090 RepID=A0A3P9M4S6_ORYLA